MEQRTIKALVYKTKNKKGFETKNFRTNLPKTWCENMGLSENDRDITLSFDGSCIKIEKKKDL